jgi:hypothetical protein
MKNIVQFIVTVGCLSMLCSFVSGCGNKEVSQSESDKMRAGMQKYPKTIDEVPKEYQEMVRTMMRQNGPPKTPPKPPEKPKK